MYKKNYIVNDIGHTSDKVCQKLYSQPYSSSCNLFYDLLYDFLDIWSNVQEKWYDERHAEFGNYMIYDEIIFSRDACNSA